MLVPPDIRESLLRDEHGIPDTDVREAMRTVDAAKRGRARTGAAEPFEGLTEAAQTARRRLRRLLPGGTSKAHEQERMWAEAGRWEAERRGAEEGSGGGDARPLCKESRKPGRPIVRVRSSTFDSALLQSAWIDHKQAGVAVPSAANVGT
jgi:hypothetical protein